MGLLAVLDHHAGDRATQPEYREEVEYRLISWGEVCAPFAGNRKHSPYGRVVLDKAPFKLVSISEPYSRPPQKLSLSFTAPMESRPEANLSGVFPHEAAQEFAAFLSVLTRRRIFAYQLSRSNDWPVEEQFEYYEQSHSQELQKPKEVEPGNVYDLLQRLRTMERAIGERFILALKFYHAAVRTLYTEPEFSYLFLVTCLEAISSAVNKEYIPDDIETYLDRRFPAWKELKAALPNDKQSGLPKILLANEGFIFGKLAKFVQDNVPDTFWNDRDDDAKPDYWTTMIVSGPNGCGQEVVKRSDCVLKEWELFDRTRLRGVLREAYTARSKLIHNGVRFPKTIVVGHFTRIPAEACSTMMQQAATGNTLVDIPPLLTFERLVSYTLINYLRNSQW